MNVCIYLASAIFITALSGCSLQSAQPVASPEKGHMERETGSVQCRQEPNLIEVDQFALTTKDLKLKYRIQNIFPQDIWVCEDIDGAGRYGEHTVVETRLVKDTLRIGLRHGNLLSNFTDPGAVWARYRRLPPQETRSHTITLPVPVRNSSPVYDAEHPLVPKKRSITLQRVLLQVGFFVGDLPSLLSQSRERGWFFPDLTYTPPPSKDPNIAFVPFPWKGTSLFEKSAELIILDVNVPGQIVADDRYMAPAYREEWRD